MKTSAVFVIAAVLCLSANADVPRLMSYQGYLTDHVGTPINGDRTMVFKLFTVASGGTEAWTQSFPAVTVTNGTFNVALDVSGVEFTQQYYLEIAVGGEIQAPRIQLTSAPYSLAPWSTNGHDVYYSHGKVGIGTDTPTEQLEITGNFRMPSASATAGIIKAGSSRLSTTTAVQISLLVVMQEILQRQASARTLVSVLAAFNR